MSTQEIPRDRWADFFEGFSLRHEGWLVTVEVLSPDFGAQVEARDLPLRGVTAELKPGVEDTISIILGGAPEGHATHRIVSPSRVLLKRTEEGADEAVEIVSAGRIVLVRFRSAVPPEMVDGIL